ncbi:hypothetical protein L1285_02115 [Pseudoalteromonas sp. DL2-H2.2]|uniref:hypothetical protein n=1 Tax=Pseudoalteromonas sp. DL2-H2.2 TaxID=2908889 RepID=UPI001F399566|nr:hypothetical protein [Pseudoalteromonas sp. DL2-H2.2]MCF2907140.1 hypothetical protein [Pseudoalteromonas sp. DL2-H2.2]
MRLSKLLLSFSVMFLLGCNSNHNKNTAASFSAQPKIYEGVDFIGSGKLKSTRCAGYTIYDGRDQGIKKATADAIAAAVSAIKVKVQSNYKSASVCTSNKQDTLCNTETHILEQIAANNFLQEIEQKIYDQPNHVVCVSMTATGGVVEQTLVELKQEVAKSNSAKTTQPLLKPAKTTTASHTKEPVTKPAPGKNLLVNGDFSTHYSNGWQLIEGRAKGIKKIKASPAGLVISYRGKRKRDTQWAIMQTIAVSPANQYTFNSKLQLNDKLSSPFSSIHLNMLSQNNELIFSQIWTSDKYYRVNHPHNIKLLQPAQPVNISQDLKALWQTYLPASQIQKITHIQVIYDVSPPAEESCNGCQMTIQHSEIQRL